MKACIKSLCSTLVLFAVFFGTVAYSCAKEVVLYSSNQPDMLRTLATLPLILPTFIGAEAWLLLLGRNGIITRQFAEFGLHIPSIYGWQGVVLVFTLQFFPFVFLMVSAAINSVDRSLEEAARNLGASPWLTTSTVPE